MTRHHSGCGVVGVDVGSELVLLQRVDVFLRPQNSHAEAGSGVSRFVEIVHDHLLVLGKKGVGQVLKKGGASKHG